jgi:hypothetical protein
MVEIGAVVFWVPGEAEAIENGFYHVDYSGRIGLLGSADCH